MTDKRKLFISYAWADDPDFVTRLYDHLTAQGFDVWRDNKALTNRGRTLNQEVRDTLHSTETLILVLGPAALQSDYVTVEWRYVPAPKQPPSQTLPPRGETGDKTLQSHLAMRERGI